MTDQRIVQIAKKFRIAIETACDAGCFENDIKFNRFPRGCCGDSSDLLAEYLMQRDIDSIYYSASRGDWSHAWLVVKDHRVKRPTTEIVTWEEEALSALKRYGLKDAGQTTSNTNYTEDDLAKGLIIDITGDQFNDYSMPVYIGCQDDFHRSFSFIEAHDYYGLDDRQRDLYTIIEQYL